MDNSIPTPAPTVALAADLLFAGRVRGAAQAVGAHVKMARSADEVLGAVRGGATLVLLDLDARHVDTSALIRSLRTGEDTRHARVVAFVSHVRADAIQAARDAGAERVLARSAFVRELPDLVAAGPS